MSASGPSLARAPRECARIAALGIPEAHRDAVAALYERYLELVAPLLEARLDQDTFTVVWDDGPR
jgi:hypothetical protein